MPTSPRNKQSISLKLSYLWLIVSIAMVIGGIIISSFIVTAKSPEDDPQIEENEYSDNALKMEDALLEAVFSFETESGRQVVANGELITYKLSIINNSDVISFSDIFIYSTLPKDTFNEDSINTNGEKDKEIVKIPSLRGGDENRVEVTRGISWTIPSLMPGGSEPLYFTGRVKCQTDGGIIQNAVNIRAKGSDGNIYQPNSNQLSVVVSLPAASTTIQLSKQPIWCSSDLRGNFDMDWADFDNDGDLDLALGSTRGATIYRNDNGNFKVVYRQDYYTLGLRWADLNNDGFMELITTGSSANNNNTISPGRNYIYEYLPNSKSFREFHAFNTPFQILRVAPGDYDGDGDVDLVVSSSALKVDYPVRLYRNNGQGHFPDSGEPISSEATADIAAADFDNDGDLDLVLSRFLSKDIIILENENHILTETHILSNTLVAYDVPFLAYNFAWGDYNGDGFLDLAAGLPIQRQVRIYHNQGGSRFDLEQIISSEQALSPRAVEWADINRDGRLDLIFIDEGIKIFIYEDGKFNQSTHIELPQSLGENNNGAVAWTIQGLDYDNDGDIDLASTSEKELATLMNTSSAPLERKLTPLEDGPAFSANCVAWADFSGNGYLDLLFSAGENGVSKNKYYINSQGRFPIGESIDTGFGPNCATIGDVNGDNLLDIAISARNRAITIIDGNDLTSRLLLSGNYQTSSLAWSDTDEDSDHNPDLLIGVDGGPNIIYINKPLSSSINLIEGWKTPEKDNTRSVAWGNYDNYDGSFSSDDIRQHNNLIDFAVGNYNQPNRIYKNKGDNTFQLVWSSKAENKTTSIAWGDYDNDGDLDLAVGNEGQANHIYENQSYRGRVIFTPIWTSTVTSNTSSIAWGDWDNDGDLDLAVGNINEADQVYNNRGSHSGSPQFDLIWESKETLPTTAIAWGDEDNDGDLELAISQNDPNKKNGRYRNVQVKPAHLSSGFNLSTIPLPNNPAYISINRPGETNDSPFPFTAKVLSLPRDHPNPVPIYFTVFDPDGSNGVRDAKNDNAFGDQISNAFYEYSYEGEGNWRKATPYSPTHNIVPTRRGESTIFWWDAVTDQAISDNVRFRICIVSQPKTTPIQRASACATSYPFRVRGATCTWPDLPSIRAEDEDGNPVPLPAVFEKPPVTLRFFGNIEKGSGSVDYIWQIHNFTPIVNPQIIKFTFNEERVYPIKLTVTGEPCPITKWVMASSVITVGNTFYQYVPIMLKEVTPTIVITSTPTISDTDNTTDTLDINANAINTPSFENSQINLRVNLQGNINKAENEINLIWANTPNVNQYSIYRRPRRNDEDFYLLANVEANINTYIDKGSVCGYIYFVRAINTYGEIVATSNSYYSPVCD